MKRYCMIATLCLFILSALPAFADDIERINAQQGYLSFQLLQNNMVVNEGQILFSPFEGNKLIYGAESAYPRTQCENGGMILDSVIIFTGTKIFHQVTGENIVLEIILYGVASPEAEIKALKEQECRNLAPKQLTIFKQTIKIPNEKSKATKVIPLEGGYAFRYQIAPLLP